MIIRYGTGGILLIFWILFFPIGLIAQDNLGKIKCICIDAGHGGKDPGCVGSKTYEKHIVLNVALKVGQMIRNQYPDIKVVYTREKDVFIDLNKRGKIANAHKADLFISIHVNAVGTKSVKGIETYVLGLHKTEENLKVAMKENAVIKYEDDYTLKYDGFDPLKAESYIIFSMMQNLFLGKSLSIAGLVQEELIRTTGKVDRSVRQAGYLVLKDVAMPAILIELGFLSNPEEERFLMSKDGQDKMAIAITKAFGRYKDEVEKNSHLLTYHADSVAAPKKIEKPETSRIETDWFYAVQVASATGKIEDPGKLYKPEKVKEIRTGNRYRYYTGESCEYAVVKQNLENVRKTVKDCFIIAVHKGKLINIAEAKKLEKKLK